MRVCHEIESGCARNASAATPSAAPRRRIAPMRTIHCESRPSVRCARSVPTPMPPPFVVPADRYRRCCRSAAQRRLCAIPNRRTPARGRRWHQGAPCPWVGAVRPDRPHLPSVPAGPSLPGLPGRADPRVLESKAPGWMPVRPQGAFGWPGNDFPRHARRRRRRRASVGRAADKALSGAHPRLVHGFLVRLAVKPGVSTGTAKSAPAAIARLQARSPFPADTRHEGTGGRLDVSLSGRSASARQRGRSRHETAVRRTAPARPYVVAVSPRHTAPVVACGETRSKS